MEGPGQLPQLIPAFDTDWITAKIATRDAAGKARHVLDGARNPPGQAGTDKRRREEQEQQSHGEGHPDTSVGIVNRLQRHGRPHHADRLPVPDDRQGDVHQFFLDSGTVADRFSHVHRSVQRLPHFRPVCVVFHRRRIGLRIADDRSVCCDERDADVEGRTVRFCQAVHRCHVFPPFHRVRQEAGLFRQPIRQPIDVRLFNEVADEHTEDPDRQPDQQDEHEGETVAKFSHVSFGPSNLYPIPLTVLM